MKGNCLMLNQIILWAMLILPWGLLFFLDKQRVSEFLPAGLFSSLLITIVFQIYERWDIVKVKETIVPLTNVPPATYGLYIALPMFFLYLTFGNFWVYWILNLVSDLVYCFVFMGLYEKFGIFDINKINYFGIFLIQQALSMLIYLFQIGYNKLREH